MDRSEERHSFTVVVRITMQSLIQKIEGCNLFYGGLKGIVHTDGRYYEYLDIKAVQSYLEGKLFIYLENGRTDGEFLKEMYRIIRGCDLKLELIDFRNCGGINDVQNHIAQLEQPVR